MRKLFLILLATSAWAQTGTITSITIEGATGAVSSPATNGGVAEITMTGLGIGGTYSLGLGTNNNPYTGSPTLTLTVTGNVYGSASTGTRTVWGTLWLRKPYPNQAAADETANGGNGIVRIVLSDYIYAGETVVGAVLSGLYTDTLSHANLTYSGAVTNNSTQAYSTMPVIGRWATVGYQRVTGAFTVEAVLFHRSAQTARPVYQVVFSCSDGGAPVTSTTSTPIISSSANQYGDNYPVVVYAGSFTASSFTQAATITCNFTAYPWSGDSTAILYSSTTTGPIVTNAKNVGGSNYAANDTGVVNGGNGDATYKVLTVSSGVVATYSLTYGGTGYSTATGATTSTGGAQPGSGIGFTLNTTVKRGLAGTPALGPILFLCDKDGTYPAAYAVVDPTNGQASAASTWVYSSQTTAENEYCAAGGGCGVGGSTANSYDNIGHAVAACKAYNNAVVTYGHNDPGGCTVELATATNTYPGTGPSSQGSMKTWFTITRLSSLTISQAAITTGAITSLNTALVHVRGITLGGSSAALLWSGNVADGLWLDGNAINTTVTNLAYQWSFGYATGNPITAINISSGLGVGGSRTGFVLVRGNSYPSTSAGVGIPADQYCVLGNKNIQPIFVNTSVGQQTSFQQFPTSDLSVVAYNSWYKYNAVILTNYESGSAPIVAGTAIVQNVGEVVVNTVGMEVADQSTANASNIVLWYNTLMGGRIDQAYNWTPSSVPLYMFQWSLVGNLWDNYNYNGDRIPSGTANQYGNILVDYSVGQRGQLKRSSNNSSAPSWCGEFLGIMTASATSCVTSGGLVTAFVADASYNEGNGGTAVGNGNYRPLSNSLAVGLIYPGSTCTLPYDADGLARNCSDYGSAGAYEQARLLTPVFW